MKISELAPNPKNPRTITDDKLTQLKKALLEFGDLSGVVYNRKTKQLVGGHQRTKLFDKETRVVITYQHLKPTKTGTLAEGYILLKGERFSYREVSWPKHREMAANLAANKGAGTWDLPQLGEWLKELSDFDVGIDLDLTMFDEDELKEFDGITVKGHTRALGKEVHDDAEINPPLCKAGQRYDLGGTKLECGVEELYFCDQILKRWEKYSGEPAKLIVKPILKKTAERSISRHA